MKKGSREINMKMAEEELQKAKYGITNFLVPTYIRRTSCRLRYSRLPI